MLSVDRVAKGLPGLEGPHSGGGDSDGFSGLRVAADTCRAVPGGKVPEPGDGDRLALAEGVGDGREHGADRGDGIGL